MAVVTVIADDLTGAADCGIAFTVAGLSTFVALGEGDAPACAVVIARDIDTRSLPAPLAEARALAAAREAYRQAPATVYKKIDSTLRGHVGTELAVTYRAAAEASSQFPILIACPAFPAAGRTVREGRVLVKGVPLAETELWRASGMAGSADLQVMLAGAGLKSVVLGQEAVRATGMVLRERLLHLALAGVQAVVCDAEDDADLGRIAVAGTALDLPVVWAGSAGLARQLPGALHLRAKPPSGPPGPPPEGPVMLVVGSRSPVAREQARRLQAQEGVVTVTADPEALLDGHAERSQGLLARIGEALGAGQDVLVLLGLEPMVGLHRGPELARRLGELLVSQAGILGGLFATGGDIARAVLKALGANGLHLLGEVEPGVPLGVTDSARPLRVVTKAGGFGSPTTLERARAVLKGGR
jgi:D-threonate/D-erythronate kinase